MMALKSPTGPSGFVELIINLDVGNPLHLQSNDNSSLVIVNVKLVGVENYKVWATAIKIALKGFIDGRIACTDAKSGSVKHTQLIRLMQFLMGDVYQPIRSTILAKDPLPNVNDAFYVVSMEESHRGLHLGGYGTNKSQLAPFNYGLIGHIMDRCYELIGYPTGFKRNPYLSRQSENNNKRFNGNSEVNHYVLSTSGSLSSSFTNDQMMKLLNLINEKPSHTVNLS
ncbi:ribonuclease H-like domain-containing protein, partial [Tanacetum coccineum]